MVTEDIVQVPTDGAGKQLRFRTVDVGSGAVYQQVYVQADSSGDIIASGSPLFVTFPSPPVVKVSGDMVVSASGIEIVWRPSIISGSVVVSGSVSISGSVTIISGILDVDSGLEIIWRGVTVSGTVTSKVSGETITTVAKYNSGEYCYTNCSAGVAQAFTIVSGQGFLHSIVLNKVTSGREFRIFDGSGGALIGAPYAGTALMPPSTLIYDISLRSGLMIFTSGVTWDLTVCYRQP